MPSLLPIIYKKLWIHYFKSFSLSESNEMLDVRWEHNSDQQAEYCSGFISPITALDLKKEK